MNTATTSFIVTVIAVVGLIVLIALNKIAANVGVPLIVALAGVHVGANLNGTSSTVTPPTIPTDKNPMNA